MDGDAVAKLVRVAIMRAISAESALAAANTELANERAMHAVTADRLGIMLHHLGSELEHKYDNEALMLEACILACEAGVWPEIIQSRRASHGAAQRALKAFLKVAPAKVPADHPGFRFLQMVQTAPHFGRSGHAS